MLQTSHHQTFNMESNFVLFHIDCLYAKKNLTIRTTTLLLFFLFFVPYFISFSSIHILYMVLLLLLFNAVPSSCHPCQLTMRCWLNLFNFSYTISFIEFHSSVLILKFIHVRNFTVHSVFV